MNTYKWNRFPAEVFSYTVWLYYWFNLTHRDIEDLLVKRGITVHESRYRLDRLPKTLWRATYSGIGFLLQPSCFAAAQL